MSQPGVFQLSQAGVLLLSGVLSLDIGENEDPAHRLSTPFLICSIHDPDYLMTISYDCHVYRVDRLLSSVFYFSDFCLCSENFEVWYFLLALVVVVVKVVMFAAKRS